MVHRGCGPSASERSLYHPKEDSLTHTASHKDKGVKHQNPTRLTKTFQMEIQLLARYYKLHIQSMINSIPCWVSNFEGIPQIDEPILFGKLEMFVSPKW